MWLPSSNSLALVQCGNDRWHGLGEAVFPDAPPGSPGSAGDPELACDKGYGIKRYYDVRSAHEAARRLRYRIPPFWEWIAIGGIGIFEVARLVVGDRGLLSVLP